MAFSASSNWRDNFACRQSLKKKGNAMHIKLLAFAMSFTILPALAQATLRGTPDEPALTAALALYGGDFLADLAMPDAEPFDE